MGPFHIPWSTFGSVLMLGVAILLAIVWALWDKSRDKPEDMGKGGS